MFKPVTADEVKRDIVEHLLCGYASATEGSRGLYFMRDLARNREYYKIEVQRNGKAAVIDYSNNLEDAIDMYNIG